MVSRKSNDGDIYIIFNNIAWLDPSVTDDGTANRLLYPYTTTRASPTAQYALHSN